MSRHKPHGMKFTPEYESWCRAKARCYNQKNNRYHSHGARGIIMCDAWKNSFEEFYKDMGPKPTSKHSIERKDNNGNYEPSNCVWATPVEQARNRRSNVYISLFGQNTPLWKANEILGLDRGTILLRAKRRKITIQESADHFAYRYNIKIVDVCKSSISETLIKLAA